MPKPPPANANSPLPLAGEVGAQRRVRVATIGRPHGIRGLVHVTSHTDPPEALTSYTPLTDDKGRQFTLRLRGEGIAEIAGITDRTAAERLVNTCLYVDRALLPATSGDEFYVTDLVGLTAIGPEGQTLGRIETVHDYGAGASLEITDGLLIPFNRASVPQVDLASGRVTVSPPEPVDIGPR